MDVNKLCYGCFREREGAGPCPHCGFDIANPKHPYIALPIGTILNGRYLTGRVLGVGGFGITYLAFDMTLEICVAVKEYLPSGIAIRDADHYTMTVSSDEEQTRYDTGATKFLDEARILAKLRKVPNIVTVHDYFRENNTAYFVMEYIEGMDLMKYTNARGGKLPFDEALALLLPIMKSLAAVHNQNLLHRDISPDNIIVMQDGSTRILDFGAARLAIDNDKSKSIILKHGFAPEEQYRKHGNQGPWSDEYALAATMYLILTGIMPPDAIERVHEDTLVSPIDLGVSMPPYANDALMKALSVHASGRFPDMKSFAYAISGKGQAQAVPAASAAISPAAPAAMTPAAPAAMNQAVPASPFTPAGAPAPAASPLTPSAMTPAASGASANASEKPAVTSPATKKTKTSIWKKPVTYIVAGIVLLAGISVPLGLYFSGAFDAKEEETTTKKPKKTTTTTTEEPTTTTEPTTEEPTTTESTTPSTTETTPAPSLLTEDPQVLAPLDLGDNTSLYTLKDLSYTVTNDWYFMDDGGFHYFFPVRGDNSNFMMFYSEFTLDPEEAKNYDFSQFVTEFINAFVTSAKFENVQLLSDDEHTETSQNYADIVMTCINKGVDVELDIRIIFDKSSGYSYCFLILLDSGNSDETMSNYRNVYFTTVDSLHLAMPDPVSLDEFKSHFNENEYIFSEENDAVATDFWNIYKYDASGSMILFSYYNYDVEDYAVTNYSASYDEILDAFYAGQFDGYLAKNGWKIVTDGTFTADSVMGYGKYRIVAVRAGNTLIVGACTDDDAAREEVARIMYGFGA